MMGQQSFKSLGLLWVGSSLYMLGTFASVDKITFYLVLVFSVLLSSISGAPTVQTCPRGKFSTNSDECKPCSMCVVPTVFEQEPECKISCPHSIGLGKEVVAELTCPPGRFLSDGCHPCTLCDDPAVASKVPGCGQCPRTEPDVTTCNDGMYYNLRMKECIHCVTCLDDQKKTFGCDQCISNSAEVPDPVDVDQQPKEETHSTVSAQSTLSQPTTMPDDAVTVERQGGVNENNVSFEDNQDTNFQAHIDDSTEGGLTFSVILATEIVVIIILLVALVAVIIKYSKLRGYVRPGVGPQDAGDSPQDVRMHHKDDNIGRGFRDNDGSPSSSGHKSIQDSLPHGPTPGKYNIPNDKQCATVMETSV